MNVSLLAVLTMWEAVLIVALVLILFGARKLPQLARGMGEGIKEFKKATKDEDKDSASNQPKIER